MNGYLQGLQSETNRILESYSAERQAEKPFRRGGVNWADLRCSDAQKIESADGDTTYRVVIEEADPDEYELQLVICKRLEAVGYPEIEVVTEW